MFRDPHAYLHDTIYNLGFEDQVDQALFDKVSLFTRQQAMLVAEVLRVKVDETETLDPTEVAQFILE